MLVRVSLDPFEIESDTHARLVKRHVGAGRDATSIEETVAEVLDEWAERWVPTHKHMPEGWTAVIARDGLDPMRVAVIAWVDDHGLWVDRSGLLDFMPTEWRPLPS